MPVRLNYEIRHCTPEEVRAMCAAFHGYGGSGELAVYTFGVYEGPFMVAAYAWLPPPPGSAMSVCKDAPAGVLALSRMVAAPKCEDPACPGHDVVFRRTQNVCGRRHLNHVSRPLRHQMKHLIDRTRWPVLVTYSDEGEGHTGNVYMRSKWKATARETAAVYKDASGKRTSSYRGGKTNTSGLTRCGDTIIQRWEHWITQDPAAWMAAHGWERVAIPGKKWRSGKQAHTWRRSTGQQDMFA